MAPTAPAPRPWRCPRDTCRAKRHDDESAYWQGCRSRAAQAAQANYRTHGEPHLASSVGIVRRLCALQAIGWPDQAIAERLGCTKQAVSWLRCGNRTTANRETRAAVDRVYNELSGTPGPSAQARRTAQRRGWAPPLAWDDIDDPDAQPDYGESHDWRWDRRAGRSEKVAELTREGLTAEQIAEHLGVTRRTVERLRAGLLSRGEAA